MSPVESSGGSGPVRTPEVFVSLSAFGATEVRRHGQLQFAQLCAVAGADGVEVREELLVDAVRELRELGTWLHDTSMQSVYSCPRPLFTADDGLDKSTLEHALEVRKLLGSRWLKMSIGHFVENPRVGWDRLLNDLSGTLGSEVAALLIENDQTREAGGINALQQFFAAVDSVGLDLRMTFDMGNWRYAGDSAQDAAVRFSDRVRYVHTKGVQRHDRWVAVPLAQSSDPWRNILTTLPAYAPRAIEYPLAADDLLALTRSELQVVRTATQPVARANGEPISDA